MGKQQFNNQPNRQQNNQITSPSNLQLDAETIKVFAENQLLEAQNEAQRLKIREKEIETNAAFARESLRLQAEFINRKPSEDRKTITRFAWIAGGFTCMLLGFVIFCLMYGERDFITKVLKGLGYLVTTALGYYLGQRTKDSNTPPNTTSPGAEIVEE